jgi:hypothetical protein
VPPAGGRLVVVGGATLLVASLLPWSSTGRGFGAAGASGWGEPAGLAIALAVALALLLAVEVVLDGAARLPAVIGSRIDPAVTAQVRLWVGVTVGLLVLVKFVWVASDIAVGAFPGVFGAGTATYGAYLMTLAGDASHAAEQRQPTEQAEPQP